MPFDLLHIGNAWPTPEDDPWNERLIHRDAVSSPLTRVMYGHAIEDFFHWGVYLDVFSVLVEPRDGLSASRQTSVDEIRRG
jgi:hypothetical protein